MQAQLFSGSSAINQTSAAFDVSAVANIGVQVIQTGGTTLNGTWYVEGSLDVPPQGASLGTGWLPTNWFNVSGTQTVTTPGTYLLASPAGYWPYIRLQWAYTSGTGGTVVGSLFTQDASNMTGSV